MHPSKIEQFVTLLPAYQVPTTQRGRKPSPFITEPDGDTRFPASRAAYSHRLHHFKVLIALDRNCPCIDPIVETRRHIGSVRRALWLYFHDCLPVFPNKQSGLHDLLATHNANLLMQGIERIILHQLQSGSITDSGYASTVLDDDRLMEFASLWFARKKSLRAI